MVLRTRIDIKWIVTKFYWFMPWIHTKKIMACRLCVPYSRFTFFSDRTTSF